jgi:hypothetical protein
MPSDLVGKEPRSKMSKHAEKVTAELLGDLEGVQRRIDLVAEDY